VLLYNCRMILHHSIWWKDRLREIFYSSVRTII
jgi:hypothetical protein